jgi:hypothetical protein
MVSIYDMVTKDTPMPSETGYRKLQDSSNRELIGGKTTITSINPRMGQQQPFSIYETIESVASK